MDIMDYQVKAKRTINRDLQDDERIAELVFGVDGEIGEVTELFKKHIYHGHSLEIKKLAEELGDVIWYLTNIASLYGIPMTYILEENIKKLEERYPEGFSVEKSINRIQYK